MPPNSAASLKWPSSGFDASHMRHTVTGNLSWLMVTLLFLDAEAGRLLFLHCH